MPRSMILCASVLMLAAAGAIIPAHRSDQSPFHAAIRPKITVIYVGAADCAPCKSWEQGDGAVFRATSEFSRISYREVKAPSTFDLLNDKYWPDELRGYRDRLPGDAGVPLWFVIADHDVVEQRFGESQWQSAVLPALNALLR